MNWYLKYFVYDKTSFKNALLVFIISIGLLFFSRCWVIVVKFSANFSVTFSWYQLLEFFITWRKFSSSLPWNHKFVEILEYFIWTEKKKTCNKQNVSFVAGTDNKTYYWKRLISNNHFNNNNNNCLLLIISEVLWFRLKNSYYT